MPGRQEHWRRIMLITYSLVQHAWLVHIQTQIDMLKCPHKFLSFIFYSIFDSVLLPSPIFQETSFWFFFQNCWGLLQNIHQNMFLIRLLIWGMEQSLKSTKDEMELSIQIFFSYYQCNIWLCVEMMKNAPR